LNRPSITKEEYLLQRMFLTYLTNSRWMDWIIINSSNPMDFFTSKVLQPIPGTLEKGKVTIDEESLMFIDAEDMIKLVKPSQLITKSQASLSINLETKGRIVTEEEKKSWMPLSMDDSIDDTFNVHLSSSIFVDVWSKRALLLKTNLSSPAFHYFLKAAEVDKIINEFDPSEILFKSESLTLTSQLLEFMSPRRNKQISSLIKRFLERFALLKGLGKVQGEYIIPLNYLKKFFTRFGLTFLDPLSFKKTVLNSVELYISSLPDKRFITNIVRNIMAEETLEQIRRVVMEIRDIVTDEFKSKRTKLLTTSLKVVQFFFEDKVIINNTYSLQMLLSRKPEKLKFHPEYVTMAYKAVTKFKEQHFNQLTYERTVRNEGAKIKYNFFHAYAQLRIRGVQYRQEFEVYRNSVLKFLPGRALQSDVFAKSDYITPSLFKKSRKAIEPLDEVRLEGKAHIQLKQMLLSNLLKAYISKKPTPKEKKRLSIVVNEWQKQISSSYKFISHISSGLSIIYLLLLKGHS